MTTRIKSARKRSKTVALRTNGKHKIDAASTMNVPVGMSRILRPQARFQWLGPQLAAITPTYIEQTMIGAMAGSYLQAWQIFDLMLKTWPELLACYNELVYGVQKKQLIFEPYREPDEKPTPSAIEKAKLVSCAIRQMQPDPTQAGDSDIMGTIADVLDAWFRGVSVSEIIWQQVDDKTVGTIWAPKATSNIDPTNYGFNAFATLGLRRDNGKSAGIWPYQTTSLNPQPSVIDQFPENKFLIAMHKASAGSQTGGALLRPLAWWWCAANFSSDWLLNLAQLFGLPFRWVTYDSSASSETVAAIDAMLQNMGSNGWARFPVGTTMEMLQTGKEGSDHSPQGELLDRADRYARSLILGQTMTGNHGTTGKGGGQAFGQVETTVKDERIEAAGDFAAAVINNQLIKAILMLNYGDADEMPTAKFLEDDAPGLIEMQRDTGLAKGGLEIGVDYLRKKYDIPEPAEGEDVIGGAKPAPSFGGFGGQDFGNQDPNASDAENPTETKAPNEESDMQGRTLCELFMDEIQGGDKPGHEFHGNQYTRGIAASLSEFTANAKLEGIAPQHNYAAATRVVNDLHEGGISIKHQAGMPIPEKAIAQSLNKFAVDRDLKSILPRHNFDASGRIIRDLRNSGYTFHKSIHASDQTGHPFRGNQYVTLGAHVNTPHGQGVVVATDPQSAWVSVNGEIRKVKKSDLSKIPTKPPFPSLLPSEENNRRLMQNAGLHTKLLELNAIEDDAVFSRELLQLTEGMK